VHFQTPSRLAFLWSPVAGLFPAVSISEEKFAVSEGKLPFYSTPLLGIRVRRGKRTAAAYHFFHATEGGPFEPRFIAVYMSTSEQELYRELHHAWIARL
jgi:hypothetical protein